MRFLNCTEWLRFVPKIKWKTCSDNSSLTGLRLSECKVKMERAMISKIPKKGKVFGNKIWQFLLHVFEIDSEQNSLQVFKIIIWRNNHKSTLKVFDSTILKMTFRHLHFREHEVGFVCYMQPRKIFFNSYFRYDHSRIRWSTLQGIWSS